MEKLGNKIENWNKDYKDLKVTYSEELVTPMNLVNFMQNEFVLEDIKKYLPGISTPSTIEVGCGGARTSLFLARRGMKVTCSDSAPGALRLAQDNFDKFKVDGVFIQDDLLNSKIPANSFDCVMSFGLLEHFEDLRPLIAALTRLTKPGGIQIHCIIPKKFSTQTIANAVLYPYTFARRFFKANFNGIFKKSFRDFPHYENTFSEEEYRQAFEAEGNTIIKSEAGGVFLPLIFLPLRLGNLVVRNFPGILCRLWRTTERTESDLMHFLAISFTIVCRKNADILVK